MAYARHVVLAILDGLRPDAIAAAPMPALASLAERGWSAVGRTVSPSVTVAALSSLATGVAPAEHGLIEPTLPPVGRLAALRPLPAELQRARHRTAVVTAALPGSHRLAARGLLSLAGVTSFVSRGVTPAETAEAALETLRRDRPSLLVLYLNQCDRAGHAGGWMSPGYLAAARTLDAAAERLAAMAEDEETLVLACADHGGGGTRPDDHDDPHPLNEAIPLIAAGRAVRAGRGIDAVHRLLDLPPTICAALGVAAPASWDGQPLPFLADLAIAAR